MSPAAPRPRWTSHLTRESETPPAVDLTAYTEDVARTLEQGFRWMHFPARLERLFEDETGLARSRHLVAVGIAWAVVIVLYALLSMGDRRAMPDLYGTALIVRLGVVTPLVLGVTFAIWWGLRPLARELAMTFANIVAPTSLIVLMALSRGGDVSVLRGALTLVLLFITVVVRLRFWYATAACLAIVFLSDVVPRLLEVPNPGNVPLLLATVVATLIANYTLEHEYRLNYLHGVMNRIQARKVAEMAERFQQLAQSDPLTGLPNRRALDDELEALRTQQEPFAVIIVDVDDFKTFNDRYGHQEGDDCLKRTAAMLRASLRNRADSVSRIGGEEFAVVLPRTSLADGYLTAERMRRAVLDLRIPHAASPPEHVVTISAGVSEGGVGASPAEVMAEADVALYRAKSSGRNRVVLFQRGEEAEVGSS